VTRQRRGEATKEHIEDAALDLFCRKGFDGASVDEIAALAGITKGALYYHFKDKNELFLTVCQKAMESYNAEVFEKSATRSSNGSGIRALIVNSHRFDQEHPRYSRLYVRLAGEDWKSKDELGPILESTFEDYRSPVQELIRGDIDRGIIRAIDIETATTILMAVLDGMSLRNTAYSRDYVEETDIGAVADTILKGFQ
jgi:AcrR family transcriptional regulator